MPDTKDTPRKANYRRKVPSQNIQTMVMAIKDRIIADADAPADKKLSVKELTSLANAAANLIKPLALADKDAIAQREKERKAAKTGPMWIGGE